MNSRILAAAALLQKAEAIVLSAAIIGIAVLTIANVLTRTLLGFSIAFTEEVSQFLIIVVTFVGLSYAAGLGRHIRMTAITDQLPATLRSGWERAVCALTALLMLVLCLCAARYVYAVYQLGGVYSVTRLPFYAVYVVAPAGFGLAAIRYGLLALSESPMGTHSEPIPPGADRD